MRELWKPVNIALASAIHRHTDAMNAYERPAQCMQSGSRQRVSRLLQTGPTAHEI